MTKCPVCAIIIIIRIQMEMRVTRLLTEAQRMQTKKMSNYSRILNTLQGKLDVQIKRAETYENELFKICEMENISLHQLRLLGYKQTFVNWRAQHSLRR